MTLDELKVEATKILSITPKEGYTHQTFSCGSGGAPRNHVKIPEVARNQKYEYPTVRCGGAYSGSVTVECRDTGTLDSNGRKIYESVNGTVFVYKYYRGSAESFDSGALVSPNMSTGV